MYVPFILQKEYHNIVNAYYNKNHRNHSTKPKFKSFDMVV